MWEFAEIANDGFVPHSSVRSFIHSCVHSLYEHLWSTEYLFCVSHCPEHWVTQGWWHPVPTEWSWAPGGAATGSTFHAEGTTWTENRIRPLEPKKERFSREKKELGTKLRVSGYLIQGCCNSHIPSWPSHSWSAQLLDTGLVLSTNFLVFSMTYYGPAGLGNNRGALCSLGILEGLPPTTNLHCWRTQETLQSSMQKCLTTWSQVSLSRISTGDSYVCQDSARVNSSLGFRHNFLVNKNKYFLY